MVDLNIDWCSYQAARYAVRHWHYAKSLPWGRTLKFGVWEDDSFIGAVVFSMGSRCAGNPYDLDNMRACELARVALREHDTPVTKMLSQTISMLKRKCPDLRLIISYADQNHGHHGGIYQAGNWIYVGEIQLDGLWLCGMLRHRRTVYTRFGTNSLQWLRDNIDPEVKWVTGLGKYKYLYPLDKAMRRQIAPLALPYPPPVDKDGNGDRLV